MAKITIKHNGFSIKLAQNGQNFIYEVMKNDKQNIIGGNVYVGDGDKLESIRKRIKEITGLDIEIDSN